MSNHKAKDHGRVIEIVAACTLGVAAIAAFAAQAFTASDGTTPTEQVLFDLLQFILSIGFAWFSTRAISRREFEQGIRRFALAAYRRVADIDSLVERLREEVAQMLAEAAPTPPAELLVVKAITTDTSQIIKSAIADWADVIGDELNTLAQIEQLQSQKVVGTESAQVVQSDSAAADIEDEIAELAKRLPPELQADIRTKDRRAEGDRFAAIWMADRHAEQAGLVLPAVTAAKYEHQRAWSSLRRGERLTTRNTKHGSLDVVDSKGLSVGRIQNISPLGYMDYVRALEVCYGDGPLDLELIESPHSEMRRGDEWAWFSVRVRNRPLVLTREETIEKWRREDIARGLTSGSE